MNPGKLPQSATEKSSIYTHAKSEKKKTTTNLKTEKIGKI